MRDRGLSAHFARNTVDMAKLGTWIAFAILLGVHTSLALAHPGTDRSPSTCRMDVQVPNGSIVSRLESAPPTLAFSPFIDPIVNRFSFASFDDFLRGLSGANPVRISGANYTFTTRYSLSAGGAAAWQYAYEQLLAMGYEVRFQSYTRSGHALKNVIARIEGETTPERIYVIGGHIDSISQSPQSLAPGAEDNGSGSAAVLAAASALAGEHFASTIELVLFSGEEQGLWGSDAYVDEAISQGRDVRAAVTMDMIAFTATDYGVLIEGGTAWASLMQAMADAVDAYTSIDRAFSYYSFGSDHVPFQQAGIPAILAIDLDWDEYPYYHRTTDTYDRTTPALGTDIGRAALATVAQLAGPLGPASSVDNDGRVRDAGRAYPNPTGSRARVVLSPSVSLTESRRAIVDAGGRVVRVLDPSGKIGAPLEWDLRDEVGRPVESGFYWLRAGDGAVRITVVR